MRRNDSVVDIINRIQELSLDILNVRNINQTGTLQQSGSSIIYQTGTGSNTLKTTNVVGNLNVSGTILGTFTYAQGGGSWSINSSSRFVSTEFVTGPCTLLVFASIDGTRTSGTTGSVDIEISRYLFVSSWGWDMTFQKSTANFLHSVCSCAVSAIVVLPSSNHRVYLTALRSATTNNFSVVYTWDWIRIS